MSEIDTSKPLGGILQSKEAQALARGAPADNIGTLTYLGAVDDMGKLDFDLGRAMFMFAGRVIEVTIVDKGSVEETRNRPTDPPPPPDHPMTGPARGLDEEERLP